MFSHAAEPLSATAHSSTPSSNQTPHPMEILADPTEQNSAMPSLSPFFRSRLRPCVGTTKAWSAKQRSATVTAQSSLMKPDAARLTRETLLVRVRRQHDEAAWAEFVHYYRGYAHSIALRMGVGHHDAEEVVQDVMLQLWKKLPEFQYDSHRGRFRGWLSTVVSNRVKNLFRRKAHEADRLPPSQQEEVKGNLHAALPLTPEEIAEQEWVNYITKMAWERIQDELGANEKNAFEMISQGQQVAEVADKLGIAESSVYVYKKRVLDRLRHEIAQLNEELD